MRTIKFRGKRLNNGEWVYGSLTQSETHNKNGEPFMVSYIAPFIPVGSECGFELVKMDRVTPTTVGQFTGLFDEDGREIYEGDIIKVREYENLLMKEFSDEPDRFDMFTLEEIRGELLKEYISPIVFDEGCFLITTIQGSYDMWLACLFGDMKRSSPSFDFDVIGNIHENPELLKGGEQ